MATDRTGALTTNVGIQKYNPDADAPSGLGFNGAMDDIDVLLAARVTKAAYTTAGDILVASGAAAPARLGVGANATVLTVVAGAPAWAAPAAGSMATIFDVQVARGNAGDPATGATVIDSNTILGGNIPQTYKHLQLVASIRSAAAVTFDNAFVRFNNDSGANYDSFWNYAQNATGASIGSGFASTVAQWGFAPGASLRAGRFGTTTMWLPDYTNAAREKTLSSQFGFLDATAVATIEGTGALAWRSTAAVTRIQWYLGGTTNIFADGTRLTLYGIS